MIFYTSFNYIFLNKKLGNLLLFFVLTLHPLWNPCLADKKINLKGTVRDLESKTPIPYASIYCEEIKTGTSANLQGFFYLPHIQKNKCRLIVSSMGYTTLDTIVYLERDSSVELLLKERQLTLEEVVVIAQEKKSIETTSEITKEALKHLQPNSFADILELIPGGISMNRGMISPNLIALREPLNAASSANRNNENNSSLGTSFLIDGAPLSNDGMLSNVSGAPLGGRGWEATINKKDITGCGIDMRTISTDDIKKVEIIRGIPSVRYGDLSSGLVKIERNYKKQPVQMRFKANPKLRLFAAGKGFAFSKHTLNLNFDYLDYKADPRNLKVNYGRFTTSLRFSNKANSRVYPLAYTMSLDYTGSFDKTKKDKETDTKDEFYKGEYNKVRLSSTINWTSEDSFINNLYATFSGSYTNNQKIIQRIASGRLSPILNEYREGEFYGEFLPATYLANLTVDDQPVFLFSKIGTNLKIDISNTRNNISIGGDWRYNKNLGEGEIYDLRRPLYAGNGRPRRSKDIPALQELSFYAEDNTVIDFGRHEFAIQAGVRASSSLGMAKKYLISSKFYLDPRVNIRWQFPDLMLWNKNIKLAVNAGFGWHTKFPTLSHLYPDRNYFDAVQLNYYSQNPKLRQMHYKTRIINPVNYNLKPNRNKKWELGLSIQSNAVSLDITAYKEIMKRGFKTLSQLDYMQYKEYKNGPHPSELKAPPTIDMFEYDSYRKFLMYHKKTNGGSEVKKGIEYQLNLGFIDLIKSRISISGAWMQMTYSLKEATYRTSHTAIGYKNYPYVGYYNWDGGQEYEQFNTNLRFDTQLKKLGLLFSSTFQILWYTNWKYTKNTGMPDYYLDVKGNKFPYKEKDTKDPILRFLYKEPKPGDFDDWRTPLAIDFNLKVTKNINQYMDLAFYVNRILYYYPDYHRKDGFKVKRDASPYFGMELNIKI